jgi:crotonobetainyl-CoA:carnitine CoA-transferase CaiB-like acyl-CoA transferase
MARAKPLEGLRVLDLTRYFSGPQTTLLLGGLGAEVVRVDDPARGDPVASSPPFVGPKGVSFERKTESDLGIAYLKRARDKKSVTLNLKSRRGKEIFLNLVDRSDVLVENFAPGVTDRLGIDYGFVHRRNPRLIYCSVTGYGSSGPDAQRKAYDGTVQAAAGLMSSTGFPDGPPTKAGSPIADGIAGVFAVAGILAALHDQQRTGEGQHVDISMVDALFSLIFDEPLDCYERLKLPPRMGNRIMRFSPFNSYPTKDGWIIVGAASTQHWHNILKAIGREKLIGDARFEEISERLARNAEVDAIIQAWSEERTSEEALQCLRTFDAICERVRDIDAIKAWPHLRAREMLVDLVHPILGAVGDVHAPGFPIKLSDAPSSYERPAPLTGQHNEEIFSGALGIGTEDLDQLKAEGII